MTFASDRKVPAPNREHRTAFDTLDAAVGAMAARLHLNGDQTRKLRSNKRIDIGDKTFIISESMAS